MRLSTRARYALRMMVTIARHDSEDGAVSLNDVAEKTRVSRRYLEQLVIALKNASLVRGISGRGGGYLLTRSAGEITLRQIIEAAIGPINIVECVLHPDACLESDFCECRWVYQTINDRIKGVLNDLSLDDLVARPQLPNPENEWVLFTSSCPTLKSKSRGFEKEVNK